MTSMITDKAPPGESGAPDLQIIQAYREHLQGRGYSPSTIDRLFLTIRHLITWLSLNRMEIETFDIRVLDQFLNHDCTCLGPHGFRKDIRSGRWHLRRFLGFLLETGHVRMPPPIRTGSHMVEAFLHMLEAQGYKPETIVTYRRMCRHLIVWLYLNDIVLAGIDDDILRRFLSHDCACAHPGFYTGQSSFTGSRFSTSVTGSFVRFLTSEGITPPRSVPVRKEKWQHLERYRTWLRHHRGLREITVQSYVYAMNAFLLPLLGDDPDRYSATLIRKTVQHRLETVSRATVKKELSVLRSYMRFLAMEGLCRAELVGAVPTVPRQRVSTLPRHLPREAIETIIASCDLTRPMGVRDRAILLLLARLALRAGDVAGLRLDDIDWDNAIVRVSGKSRRAAVLPLPQDVGEAIRDYILKVRPAVTTRNVFLRMLPPHHQPLTSGGVSRVAHAAIRRSGIKAERGQSSHVFRHSAATNMLRDNTPLEVISTLLRHQSVETTAVYARVDVRMLREVAQPWPVKGGAR